MEIDDAFLLKLAEIESDVNDYAVGDRKIGVALGRYQIRRNAWNDACKRNNVDWKFNRKNAFNNVVAKVVVKWHLEWLAENIKANGFQVTPLRLYMCYNMGLAKSKKLNFDPPNTKQIIRAKKIFNEPKIQSRPTTKFNTEYSLYDRNIC